MKHNEAVKRIEKAFWRLAKCCESSRDWDRYLAIIEREEKEHRCFCPWGVENGLTKAQAVKLFAVQGIFERWVPGEGAEKPFTPAAGDFFTIRASCFAACAVAQGKVAEIPAEFPIPEMADWLRVIDYAELNKDPRQAVAA